MSAVRRGASKRSLAFAVAVLSVFAVLVPFAGTATANHGDCALDVEPELGNNPVGSTHTLTARIQTVVGGVIQECTPGPGPINIDFEVTGAGDPDNNADPTNPDFTCNIVFQAGGGPANDQCQVFFQSNEPGDSDIIAWIDHDQNNATFEGDAAEGRNENIPPGNVPEQDITDLVEKDGFV